VGTLKHDVSDRETREEPGAVEVEEVRLPGVGLRHDFQTRSGRRVGVVSHRSGRRDLVVYDTRDPDACSEVVKLATDEADALAELLGAPRIVERLASMRDQVADLEVERLPIAADSPYARRTLGDTQARTRTGASVVAVLRGQRMIASPGPDFKFEPADVVVVVGTREGIEAVARILEG
jgi:TrkA domain protein